MSLVTVEPEALTVAAASLAAIGSELNTEIATATAPMASLVPAAADEVSAANAAQFGAYAHAYQQIVAQGARVHEQIVHTMHTNAGSYGNAESDNAASASAGSGLSSIGQSATAGGGGGGPTIPPLSLGSLATPYRTATVIASMAMSAAPKAAVPADSTLAAGLGFNGAAGGPGAVVAAGSGGSGAPVSARMARAASVGSLSVPQSWTAGPAAGANLAGTALPDSQLSAAPEATPTTPAVPGMPLAGQRANHDTDNHRRLAGRGQNRVHDQHSEKES